MNTNKIHTISYALTFAGCFLGAGYVSGQELWQFFGSFGTSGWLGLILAMVLLAVFGILLLSIARNSGKYQMDEVVVLKDIPWLRAVFGGLETFFLFGIYVIMSAGAGALINQLFGLPSFLGSLLLCMIVTVVAIKGFSGMVRAFSAIVPLMIVTTLALCVCKLSTAELQNLHQVTNTNQNPLISHWLISSVTFVSYNLFSSIGIICPFGQIKKKTAVFGTALGAVFLFVIAGGILIATMLTDGASESELPMLLVAQNIHGALGIFYGLLLFGGMFGTSLSCMVAADNYLRQKIRILENKKIIILTVSGIFSFAFSRFGFSNLISTAFPICGYLGLLALIGVILSFVQLKKK